MEHIITFYAQILLYDASDALVSHILDYIKRPSTRMILLFETALHRFHYLVHEGVRILLHRECVSKAISNNASYINAMEGNAYKLHHLVSLINSNAW